MLILLSKFSLFAKSLSDIWRNRIFPTLDFSCKEKTIVLEGSETSVT